MTAAARWIATHPERLRSAVARVVDRPRVLRLRRRYRHQIVWAVAVLITNAAGTPADIGSSTPSSADT